MMTADEVIRVLNTLDRDGPDVWLDGGWGVDALLGEQTHDHSDLDLVIRSDHVSAAIVALSELGYAIEFDGRPTRFVLSATDGRRIDFHPVTFDRRGDAVQTGAGPAGGDAHYPAAGFAGQGNISGRSVTCLTPELLVLHHMGYAPADKDRHNVRLLCERFGINLPPAYA